MEKKTLLKLKKEAHHLKPVIMIGQKGLTEAVIAETEIALDTHELIKIKIASTDRDARKEVISQVCEKTQAELVTDIGKIAIVYRKKVEN